MLWGPCGRVVRPCRYDTLTGDLAVVLARTGLAAVHVVSSSYLPALDKLLRPPLQAWRS